MASSCRIAAIAAWSLGVWAGVGAGPSATDVLAHEGGFEVRSTESGGGVLAVTAGPHGPVPVALVFCSSGECLYENAETTIHTPEEGLALPPLFPLAAGTQLALELVSRDDGVSIKVGGTNLDQPGETATIGTAPSLHAEPTLQVTTTEETVGDWHLTLRLSNPAGAYDASDLVELVLTNDASVCGDGHVDEHEDCDGGDVPWTSGHACNDHCEWLACGDPDGDGEARASDALFVLGAAVGSHHCDACLCDVDASGGGAPLSSVDALRVLAAAIGIGDVSLSCPPCP